MDQSYKYGRMSTEQFNSAYNYSPHINGLSTVDYIPSSTRNFYSARSVSPPSSRFSFDLYEPIAPTNDDSQYFLPASYRSVSPTTSAVVFHHPVSTATQNSNISKLRQINDELSNTLAKCDALETTPTSQPYFIPMTQQTHIHHHPVSQPRMVQHHRSQSPNDNHSISSIEDDYAPPKRHNARINYNIRVPRSRVSRPRSTDLTDAEKLLVSSSDVYASQDPLTIDLFPHQDYGFVRRVRGRQDNTKPWLPDQPSILRRNSYSDPVSARISSQFSPIQYGTEPIMPTTRLSQPRNIERIPSHRSSLRKTLRPARSMTSLPTNRTAFGPKSTIEPRNFPRSHAQVQRVTVPKEPVWRPGGKPPAPKYIRALDPARKESTVSKSKESIWQPAGKISPTKYVRALDPGVRESNVIKTEAPTWKPSSAKVPTKTTKYFEPAVRESTVVKTEAPTWKPSSAKVATEIPKYFEPTVTEKRAASPLKQSQAEKGSERTKSPAKTMKLNPDYKKRVSQAESKIKAAWQSSATKSDQNPTQKKIVSSKDNETPATKRTVDQKPKSSASSKVALKTTAKYPDWPPRPPVKIPASSSKPKTKISDTKPESKAQPKSSNNPKVQNTIKPKNDGKIDIPLEALPDTGRSSIDGHEDPPQFRSTPKNRSFQSDNLDEIFGNESKIESDTKPTTRKETTPPRKPPKLDDSEVHEDIAENTASEDETTEKELSLKKTDDKPQRDSPSNKSVVSDRAVPHKNLDDEKQPPEDSRVSSSISFEDPSSKDTNDDENTISMQKFKKSIDTDRASGKDRSTAKRSTSSSQKSLLESDRSAKETPHSKRDEKDRTKQDDTDAHDDDDDIAVVDDDQDKLAPSKQEPEVKDEADDFFD